jgi:hypothetical protein
VRRRSGAIALNEPDYSTHPSIGPSKRGGILKIAQIWIVAATGVMLACASKPTPVTVTGDSGDRASLAGKWVGEYNSPVTGRSGSIVFNLSPSGDAANGDVVMVPRGYGKALQPYNVANPGAASGVPSASPSQVLTIRLVRVSGDTVSGVLDAYRDPECDCPVETTFTGRLSGDTIEGTFSTSGRQAAAPQTGTWRVKRSR